MPLRKSGSRFARSEQPASRRSGSCASAFRRKRLARSQTRPRKRLRPDHLDPRRSRSIPLRQERRTPRWRSMSLLPPPPRPVRRVILLRRRHRVSPTIRRRGIPRNPCKRTKTTQSNIRSQACFALPFLPFVFMLVGFFFTTVGLLRTKGRYWQFTKVMRSCLCPIFTSACM